MSAPIRPPTGGSASSVENAAHPRKPTAPTTARASRRVLPTASAAATNAALPPRLGSSQGAAVRPPLVNALVPLDAPRALHPHGGPAPYRPSTGGSCAGAPLVTHRKPYVPFPATSTSVDGAIMGNDAEAQRRQSAASINRQLLAEFFESSAPVDGDDGAAPGVPSGAEIFPHTLQMLIGSGSRALNRREQRLTPAASAEASAENRCSDIPTTFQVGSSCNVDADNALIRKIISLHNERRGVRGSGRQPLGGKNGQLDVASTFFMDSVLDVSKAVSGNAATGGGTGAAVAPPASKIPVRHWVLREGPVRELNMTEEQLQREYDSEGRLFKRIVFPSAHPANRPEVFFLAQTLDLMCDEIPNCDALFDADAAFSLPTAAGGEKWDAFDAGADTYCLAGSQLVRVLDAALSEVARQVAPTCVERAALLDRIRMVTSDFATTCLDVVAHCKRLAAAAIAERDAERAARLEKNDECAELGAAVLRIQCEAQRLQDELAEAVVEKERLQDVLGRSDVKEQLENRGVARQFTVQALSDAAEGMVAATVLESSPSAASARRKTTVSATSDSNLDQTAAVDAEGVGGGGGDGDLAAAVQQSKEDEALYHHTLQFLASLNAAVAATDSACAPFYQQSLFGQPSLNTTVARNKWIDIARAVGRHEVLLERRELLMRKLDAKRNAAASSTTARRWGGGGSGSNLSSFKGSNQSTLGPSASRSEAAAAAQVADDTDTDALHRELAVVESDEAFLHPTLQLPPRYGVRPDELMAMLRDTRCTMDEICSRLRALSESEALRRCAEPPAMPPSNPDQPCNLCGRVDWVGAERKKRNEAVQRVAAAAREEASRLEQTIKRQAAEMQTLQRQVLKHQKLQKEYEGRLVEMQMAGGRFGVTGAAGSPTRHGDSPMVPLNPGAWGALATDGGLGGASSPVSAGPPGQRNNSVGTASPGSPSGARTKSQTPPLCHPIDIPIIDVTAAAADDGGTESATPPSLQLQPPAAVAASPDSSSGPPKRLPRRDTALPSEKPSVPPVALMMSAPTPDIPHRSASPPLVLNLVINCSCKAKGGANPAKKALRPTNVDGSSSVVAAFRTAAAAATATNNNKSPNTSPSERSNSLSSQASLTNLPALAFDADMPLTKQGSMSQTSVVTSQRNSLSTHSHGNASSGSFGPQAPASASNGATAVVPPVLETAIGGQPTSETATDAENLEAAIGVEWTATARRALMLMCPHRVDILPPPSGVSVEEQRHGAADELTSVLSTLEKIVYASGKTVSGGARIRPVGWALRTIAAFMAGKLEEDLVRTFEGKPIRGCHEYLTVFLRQQYGAPALVDDAALQLVVVLYRHLVGETAFDARLTLFVRFLCGNYPARTLNFVLRLGRVAAEAAVGPEYDKSTAAPDDNAARPARMSMMRVVFVVDAVLARKPYRAALLRLCWRLAQPVEDEAAYREAMLRGVHHSCKTPVALVPKSWTASDVALSRMVLARSTFLAVAAHFEAVANGEDQQQRSE